MGHIVYNKEQREIHSKSCNDPECTILNPDKGRKFDTEKRRWHLAPSILDEGRKFDSGKLRWDLLPFDIIEGVVEILTHGAEKYDPNNWQKVETNRHFAAGMRHISSYKQGDLLDKDSGLPHLYHALCDLMFVAWQEKHKPIPEKDDR